MPCNAVRTMSLELTASDPSILADALRDAGLPNDAAVVRRIIDEGRIQITASAWTIGEESRKVPEVRRRYAEGVVEEAARRHGWRVEREDVRDGRTVLQVSRR